MSRIKTYELFETSPSAYFMEEPGWEAHQKAQPSGQPKTKEDLKDYIAIALQHAYNMGRGNNKIDFQAMARDIVYDIEERF